MLAACPESGTPLPPPGDSGLLDLSFVDASLDQTGTDNAQADTGGTDVTADVATDPGSPDLATQDQPTDPGTDPGPADVPVDNTPPQDTGGQTTYEGGDPAGRDRLRHHQHGSGGRPLHAGAPASPDTSFGDCSVTFQNPNSPPADEHGFDAGVITVTGAPVTLTPVNEGANGTGYQSNLNSDLVDLLPNVGALMTFTGAGGADIGAFTIVLQNPEPVTINSPSVGGGGGSASKSSPLTVTWVTGNGDQMIISISPLTNDLIPEPASGNALVCVVQGDTGSVTIPTAALAMLSGGNSVLGVTRLKTKTGDAQGSTVSASITRSRVGILSLN